MRSLKEYQAAMAATLIDDEIAWMLDRLPEEKARNPFQRAVLKEAARRGIGPVSRAE
jgi:hypothetical protein